MFRGRAFLESKLIPPDYSPKPEQATVQQFHTETMRTAKTKKGEVGTKKPVYCSLIMSNYLVNAVY